MNTAEIQGRISDVFVGRNVIIVTLFVEGKKNNFPQVVFNFPERALVENYKKGDFVNIVGSIKVRGVKTENGKNYFDQYIRGYTIFPVGTEMSEKFHKNLGGMYQYKNEVLLEGTVTAINNNHGVFNVLLKPYGEKFNVWCSNYYFNVDKMLQKYSVGDNICVKCELQTAKKVKEGEKPKYYENLILKYISAVNE